MVKKKITLQGKIYPFNKGVFNMLDAEDKVNYKKSHATKSKIKRKNF